VFASAGSLYGFTLRAGAARLWNRRIMFDVIDFSGIICKNHVEVNKTMLSSLVRHMRID